MPNNQVLTIVDEYDNEIYLSPDKTYFLSHPCTTGGEGEVANRKREEECYQFLVSKCKDIKIVRPLKIIPPNAGYNEAMDKSFRLMESCDVFIFAPGWEGSKGCNDENYWCFKHGYSTAHFEFKDFPKLEEHPIDINLEAPSCFRCAQRDGRFCLAKEQRTTLANVGGNIFVFQDQNGCPAYVDQRNL